jgi:hypothetical protein
MVVVRKRPRRYTSTLTVKVPDTVAAKIRRRADEDDRTPAAYVRRLLIDVTKADPEEQTANSGA